MPYLRWVLLIGLLFVLVVFQTSAAPSFPIFGTAPQVVLVFLCCWAIVRPPTETLVMIPLAGIGLGLMAYQGMAESVAALAPIGFAALTWGQYRESRRFTPIALEWYAAIVLIAVASVLHFTAHAIAVELSTSGVNWLAALRTVMLGGLLGNMLLGAVVFWFVRIPTSGAATLRASSRSAGF